LEKNSLQYCANHAKIARNTFFDQADKIVKESMSLIPTKIYPTRIALVDLNLKEI